MKIFSRVCPLLLIVFLSPLRSAFAGRPAAAQIDSSALTTFIEAQLRTANIPGAAVSIVRGHRIIFASGFGGTENASITADTPFFIGSITKTLTALAVAQLVEQGHLDFDAPVRRYLPDFHLKDPDATRKLTLRHLLTHTSGLSQWSGHDRRAQQQARFDHIEPVRPPGQAVEYSSLNYIILGHVIETVTRQSYPAYLQEHIFTPLGMRHSSAHPTATTEANLAQGYWYLFGWPMPGAEPAPPSPLIPAGFVTSSASDMARYLSIYLTAKDSTNHQIVTPATRRTMLTPWDGDQTGIAMAWAIDDKLGMRSVNHAGNTRTFSARVRLFPEHHLGIVVLTNINSGPFYPGSAALMDGIVRIVHGQSVSPGWPWELIVKWIILGLVLLGTARMLWHAKRWRQCGFPMTLAPTFHVIGRLVFDLGLAIALFVGIPRWAGVPMHTLIAYFPDLGYALIIGLGTGGLEGILRAFLRSDEQSPSEPVPMFHQRL